MNGNLFVALREAFPADLDATAIDSSGVSDLASGHMMVTKRGGALKLCCLSKKLKDVFVITRLNTVFELFETEAEALESAPSV